MIHRDIGAMTLWELRCAMQGYAEAHGVKRSGGSLSEERLAEMGIEGF